MKTLKIGVVHFLQLSLGVVLLALLPNIIASMPALNEWVWRLSNGVIGTFHAYALWWILTNLQESPGHTQLGPGLTRLLALMGMAITVLHLAVASGFLPEMQVFAFLFGLFWILGMALVNFVAILLHQLNME